MPEDTINDYIDRMIRVSVDYGEITMAFIRSIKIGVVDPHEFVAYKKIIFP